MYAIFQYPAIVEVIKYDCQNQEKACEKLYDFENNAIFVWSKETCIGDEVFCQFFSGRGKRAIYFNTYCHEMTEAYRDSNINSSKFLHHQTFISCMMSWIINQGIDYRSIDAICPFCGHNPEVLACDGVSVGVNLKRLTRLEDITSSEKKEVKPFVHRRNTRILFSGTKERDKAERKYVLGFCDHILDTVKTKKKSKKNEETENNGFNHCDRTRTDILQKIDDLPSKAFLKGFFDEQYPMELSKVMAKFLKALNGTASLINFFPTKDRTWLYEVFENLKIETLSDTELHFNMKKLHSFRIQFNEIMKVASRHQKQKEMASFFQFLIQKTEEIHKNDSSLKPDEPEVVDAYDPTTGISYNFTPHGGQIRKLPKYKVQGTFTSHNPVIFN